MTPDCSVSFEDYPSKADGLRSSVEEGVLKALHDACISLKSAQLIAFARVLI